MALSTNSKVLIGLAVLGVGGYTAYHFRMKKKKIATKPLSGLEGTSDQPLFFFGIPTLDAGGSDSEIVMTRDEPLGGWQYRWEERGPQAIEKCRKAEVITTFAEAQLCILATVFPEAIPWGGSEDGYRPWMYEARDAVREQIREETRQFLGITGGAQTWQFLLWLMFDRFYVDCVQSLGADINAVSHCLATQIYSGWDWLEWPPQAGSEAWQTKAWNIIKEMVLERFESPTPTGAGGFVLT